MALLLLAVLLLFCSLSKAQNDQGATVGDFGSNTQQSADTIDNRTMSETKVSQEGAVVNTAVSPSSTNMNQDVCFYAKGAGVQSQVFGISIGNPVVDETCQLIKLSRQMAALGLKVPAVSVLCNDPRVWWALYDSGIPCPANQGLINDDAYSFYKHRPDRVPDRPDIYRSESAIRPSDPITTNNYSRIR